MNDKKENAIWTIGHSTLREEEFIDLLKNFGIKRLIDVRRFPTSKKYPQFKREHLKRSLEEAGIEYVYLGDLLGGYRKGGYPAYIKTDSFKEGLSRLISLARNKRTVIMCAEKLFFRCHRRFIADELVKRGLKVIHIIDKKRVYEHKTTK